MSTKYKEILKLKQLLEDNNIPFDWIEGWGYDKEKTEKLTIIAPDLMEHYQICYPKGSFNGKISRKISVIEGFGTYGAEADKLEIMGLLTPEEKKHDTVAGWLSAEDVFNRIKTDYERRPKMKKKSVKYVDEDTLELKEMIIEEESDEDGEVYHTALEGVLTSLNCDGKEFYQKYADYKKAEEEWKQLYEPFKKGLIRLHEEMPDMPKSVVIGGAKFTYVAPSIRSTLDSQKLKEEEPELVKKFMKTSDVAATVRIADMF